MPDENEAGGSVRGQAPGASPPEQGRVLQLARDAADAVYWQINTQPGAFNLSFETVRRELLALRRHVNALIGDLTDEITSIKEELAANHPEPKKGHKR